MMPSRLLLSFHRGFAFVPVAAAYLVLVRPMKVLYRFFVIVLLAALSGLCLAHWTGISDDRLAFETLATIIVFMALVALIRVQSRSWQRPSSLDEELGEDTGPRIWPWFGL